MVQCTQACEGIVCDRFTGQIPRCMVFQFKDRDISARGVAVVGLNPGKSREAEQSHYLRSDCSYESVVSWIIENGLQRRFYSRLSDLVTAMGLRGPILWTELAKCECASGVVEPPLQTFRMCVGKYLFRELQVIPSDWPLIGVGKEAFRALAYLFSDRTVIGIPHPTGSYGNQFHGLLDGNNIHSSHRSVVADCLDTPGRVCWLTAGL